MPLVRAVAALLLTVCLSAQAAEPRKLIVICIDGLDARYLKDADKLHLKIPVLRKLMKQGVTADGVSKVLPDNSWAASATIATGVAPAQAAKVQTLWQMAMAAHRKTALIYWPGSAGAAADYLCPEPEEGRMAVDPSFDAVAQKCTPGLTQHIASAFPTFLKAKWSDASALAALRYLVQSGQPDLTMVHLTDLEGEETETGALSIYSREVLESDDDLIGLALAKRSPRTVVAIVSDHGFDTENYIVRAKVLAGSSAVEVKYGLVGAKDQKAAAALRKWVGNKKGGIAREVSLAEVKKAAPEVTGWVAAFATMQGYVASDSAGGKAVGPGRHNGVPGAWPMRAGFVLSGAGVKPGRVGEISILDIAPTLADVLEVKLPDARGKSLWPKVAVQ